MPEPTKPALIGNADQLARLPDAAVLLIDGRAAFDAASVYFTSNPVLGWDADAVPYVEALAGRRVIVWPAPGGKGGARWMALRAALVPVVAALHLVEVATPLDALTQQDAVRTLRRPEAVRTIDLCSTAVVDVPAQTQEASEHEPEPFNILTERFLAERLCTAHPGLRFVDVWGKWLEWTGAKWQIEDTRKVLHLASNVCAEAVLQLEDATPRDVKTAESASLRANVESLAREDRRMAARVDQWDMDTWVLNTPGGGIDLHTGDIRAARMDDYCTKSTAVTPAGECPQWLAFLRTVCDFDDDLVAFLQRMIGYSLTGDTREQCLFFCYGTGANGKGTFLNTLSRILGDYATIAGMDVFTESKHDRHPQELARLRGARMVCAQETEQGRRWAESRIKALTGGDPITAHFMRQDDFTFMPQFKLIIAGNHKPGLRNVDEAMKRRLHLVPFTVTIPTDKRDKLLAEKLWAEAPGILRWAIEGCMAWQRAGLQPPKAVRDATDEYLKSQDSFATWMDECCEVGHGHKERTGWLYRSYRAWVDARGEHACGQGRFNEMLEQRGHNITKTQNVPFASGIALKAEQSQPSGMFAD